MPDITQSSYKAEFWSFWAIYLAPPLLQYRFPKPKYYTHFLLLVDIIKQTIQLSITTEELDSLEENIIKWVEQYERWYYKYEEDHLPACTFNLHALLHIVAYI
ncbi:hypothetical protein BU17DRAFT_60017 [Hysterangium stoloniferum]|nr:hypothetical protein BU17DRAFT_60017 [Hysterangium stoloniferum]